MSTETYDRTTPPGELPEAPPDPDMVWIPGGTFRMGSEDFYPEERPIHQVQVDGFWMDKYQVSNRAYDSFVRDTGYVTVAERTPSPGDYPGAPPENLVPGSLVFHMTPGPVNLEHINLWWDWKPGASWRRPEGPRSHIRKRKHHPVVHICYEDALAYAHWAGKALPSKAEWEFAAQGGQGRFLSVRTQRLSALPACCPPSADGRHRHNPYRISLRCA